MAHDAPDFKIHVRRDDDIGKCRILGLQRYAAVFVPVALDREITINDSEHDVAVGGCARAKVATGLVTSIELKSIGLLMISVMALRVVVRWQRSNGFETGRITARETARLCGLKASYCWIGCRSLQGVCSVLRFR